MDASFTQTSFLGGEWSPYMQGRFDRPDYRTALNVCLNALPIEEGAWTRRPGTRRLAPTRKGLKAVLREFHFSGLQPYLMEFSPLHLRFFAGTSLVLDGTLGKFVVANVTTATPPVVSTYMPHGMTDLDQVQFEFPEGVSIPTAAALMNRQFEIDVTGTHTFTLYDSVIGDAIDGTDLDLDGNVILVGRVLDLTTTYPDDEDALQAIRVVQGQDKDATSVALIMDGVVKPQALRVATPPAGCVPAAFDFGPAVFLDGPYQDPIADGSTALPDALTGTITLTVTPGSLPLRPEFDGFVSTDVGRMIRLRSEPLDWDDGTAYAVGDHVKFDDTYWTALAVNTDKQPDLDVVNWAIDPAASRWTWGTVSSVTSANVVELLIKGNDLLYVASIRQWRLGLYSDTTGWPGVGTFHEGRLWLAGAQDNRFDGSKSNDFFNFSPTAEDGTVADNDAISYVLNSKDVNPIFWMEPDKNGFLMGTQDGEWLVRATTLSEPLSPTSIQAKRETKYGCANIEPRRSGLALAVVQRDAKNVIEYMADPSGGFGGQNLALKGKHLMHVGIAELAYVSLTTPIVWARTVDGDLIGCTYKRDNPYASQPESFSGWHRHGLGGDDTSIFSIASGPSVDGETDALSMVVTGPSEVYYVETLTPVFEEDQSQLTAWFLDHALRPPAAEVVTVAMVDYVRLWGLEEFAGKTVQVWGAGLDLGDFLVTADGSVDVPISTTGDFTAAYLAQLTLESDSFTGFAVTITRASTGAIPTPASANSISEYTPAYPDVSEAGVAVNWDAEYIWISNQGNGATDGLLQFNAAGGAAVATKTVVNIFGSSGGGQQFVQAPISYCGDGVSLFWSCTSSNSGPVIKYNPVTGVAVTLGTSNASLTNTADHIMKGLTQAPLSCGDDYMLIPSLVGSPGLSSACSVAVVNTTDLSFFEAVSLATADQRGLVCPGPTASFECYHSGTCFLLGGPKMSIWLQGSSQALTIYNYTISAWGDEDPTGALTSMGTISPSEVDPTWTHWTRWEGLIYDETDQCVIAAAHIQAPAAWSAVATYTALELALGSNNHVFRSKAGANLNHDPAGAGAAFWDDLGVATYTHSDYLFKLNPLTANVVWAVYVTAIPASSDDWNETRIQNGRLAYLDGAVGGTLSVIDTATGSRTSSTLTGVTKGGPFLYDDVTGRIIFYTSAYSNTGVIQPVPPTPTSFTNAWSTLASSGALVKPVYEAPFVVGYTYTSDGQIVRPIHATETGAANGPALAKTRRTHQFAAVMHKAKGVSFGTLFTKLRPGDFATAGGDPLTAFQLYSGTYWNTLEDDYSFDSMLCWRITRPYPTTVLAVVSFLHTSDR